GSARARGDGPLRLPGRVPRPLLREAALPLRPARTRRPVHVPRARARRRGARPRTEPQVRLQRSGARVRVLLFTCLGLVVLAVACGEDKTQYSYAKSSDCLKGVGKTSVTRRGQTVVRVTD